MASPPGNSCWGSNGQPTWTRWQEEDWPPGGTGPANAGSNPAPTWPKTSLGAMTDNANPAPHNVLCPEDPDQPKMRDDKHS
eukprot:7656272-Lingulodinium_polyedra.AAC.1